jgi:pimeloyl-ACP methyl ester carboxylesterase
VAASPVQGLFARTVLLSPFLGYKAVSTRPHAGGWASPDLPRIIGLYILRSLGITCCDQLPVIAFAVPAHSTRILTGEYSFRLLTNFGANRDYRDDLNAARGPLTLIAGANDELMFAGKYAEAVAGTAAKIDVRILDNVNHMDVVSTANALPAVVEDIATH